MLKMLTFQKRPLVAQIALVFYVLKLCFKFPTLPPEGAFVNVYTFLAFMTTWSKNTFIFLKDGLVAKQSSEAYQGECFASTFPPAIEAPQLGIMSANLTVNDPNISVWVIHEQILSNPLSELEDSS